MEPLPSYDLSSSISTLSIDGCEESRVDLDNPQSVPVDFSDMLTGAVTIAPKRMAEVFGINVLLVRSESLECDKKPMGVEQLYTTIASCYLPMDVVLVRDIGYRIAFSLRVPDREEFFEKQIVPIPSIGSSLLLWNNAERVVVRYYLRAIVDGRGDLPKVRPSRTIKFSPAPAPLCPTELLRTSQTFTVAERQLFYRGAVFRAKKQFHASLAVQANPIIHDWFSDKGTTTLKFRLFDFDQTRARDLPATVTLSCSLLRQLETFTSTGKKGHERHKRSVLLRFCQQKYACKWVEDTTVTYPQLLMSLDVSHAAPTRIAAPFDDHHMSLSYSMRITCQIARETFDIIVPFIPIVPPSECTEDIPCSPPQYLK